MNPVALIRLFDFITDNLNVRHPTPAISAVSMVTKVCKPSSITFFHSWHFVFTVRRGVLVKCSLC